MTVQRNGCKCEKSNPRPAVINDKFKTIICDSCMEVISYEKIKLPKKKKSKKVIDKDQEIKIVDLGGKHPQVEMNI